MNMMYCCTVYCTCTCFTCIYTINHAYAEIEYAADGRHRLAEGGEWQSKLASDEGFMPGPTSLLDMLSFDNIPGTNHTTSQVCSHCSMSWTAWLVGAALLRLETFCSVATENVLTESSRTKEEAVKNPEPASHTTNVFSIFGTERQKAPSTIGNDAVFSLRFLPPQ